MIAKKLHLQKCQCGRIAEVVLTDDKLPAIYKCQSCYVKEFSYVPLEKSFNLSPINGKTSHMVKARIVPNFSGTIYKKDLKNEKIKSDIRCVTLPENF